MQIHITDKKKAYQTLINHFECYGVALLNSHLSKETLDKLFTIKLMVSGCEIVLAPTPENFKLLKELLSE